MKRGMGLVGEKIGMTRMYNPDGSADPVVIVKIKNKQNVSCIKTSLKDGYNAIQVTYGEVKASKVNKARAGFFSKINIEAGRKLREYRVEENELVEYQIGQHLDVSLFEEGSLLDVQGCTKGKGFAGTVKRHNFRTQDATHGNSVSHRVPGSIGQRQTPGRVFKGKKMSGHMGSVMRTAQNLKLVRIDKERNLLWVKGCVPGAKGSELFIYTAQKGNN